MTCKCFFLNKNPLFIDEENNNYNISEASLCVDAGNSEIENIPETDFIGNQRISGTSIDIGAYEYQK